MLNDEHTLCQLWQMQPNPSNHFDRAFSSKKNAFFQVFCNFCLAEIAYQVRHLLY